MYLLLLSSESDKEGRTTTNDTGENPEEKKYSEFFLDSPEKFKKKKLQRSLRWFYKHKTDTFNRQLK